MSDEIDYYTLQPRLLQLAQRALALGRVERITLHEDSVRPETDADHTIMLVLVACEIAHEINEARRSDWPCFDEGLVASFAVVHDLHESDPDVGDTQTFRISAEETKAKRAREQVGIDRLFAAGGWVGERVGQYHGAQVLHGQRASWLAEARLVYYVDKLLPKLTHALNNGAALRAIGADSAELKARLDRQELELAPYAKEFPEVAALHLWARGLAETALQGHRGPR